MRDKHICLISPSFNIGGIERTVSEFANYFCSLGYKITFVTLLSGKRYFQLDNKIIVKKPEFDRGNTKIINFFYRLRLVFFMRNIVKKDKPDVVLSMADSFNYLVIASLVGLPCNVFVGDVTKPDRKLAILTRLGKKFLYPLATGFIAQTNTAANYYRNIFGDEFNMRVINGAVKRIEKFDIEKEKIILCAGRLSFEKGQDRLIEAFAILQQVQDWKIVLTADGPFKSRLVELVSSKKLESQVVFVGKVDNIDLLYAQARIFVLPSRIEGFPNALTEAMAAGLPCICYDSFPAEEIIENGVDGIIAKDGDIEILADKIQLLISDHAMRAKIGKNASQISARLSIEIIGNEMLEFILPERE